MSIRISADIVGEEGIEKLLIGLHVQGEYSFHEMRNHEKYGTALLDKSVDCFLYQREKKYVDVPFMLGKQIYQQRGMLLPSGNVNQLMEKRKIEVSFLGTLRDYQVPLLEQCEEMLEKNDCVLIHAAPGRGKCLGINTPVMMFDGSIKPVQDIQKDDLIMGDDSLPRRILSISRGREKMYKIKQLYGDDYIVNESHILSLKLSKNPRVIINKTKTISVYWYNYENKKHSKLFYINEQDKCDKFVETLPKQGHIIDISVKEYLTRSKSWKAAFKGFKVGVDYLPKEITLDPYILGLWLGDGTTRTTGFTTNDPELLKYFEDAYPNLTVKKSVDKYGYRITRKNGRKGNDINTFLEDLRSLHLIGNKHIPSQYLYNSRRVRLELLAGLLDTDGHNSSNSGYDFIQKNKVLAEQTCILARSLGFRVSFSPCEKSCMYKGEKKTGTYYRLTISGFLSEIPLRLERKKITVERKINKNPLVYGIEVIPLEEDEYYGFEIDGNRRFLLGDFTVTHNTIMSIYLSTRLGYTTLVVFNRSALKEQWKDSVEKVSDGKVWVYGEKIPEHKVDIIVTMVDGLNKIPTEFLDKIGTVIFDEAHMLMTPKQVPAILRLRPVKLILCTATPDRDERTTTILGSFVSHCRVVKRYDGFLKIIKFRTNIYLEEKQLRRGGLDWTDYVKKQQQNEARNYQVVDWVKKNKDKKILIMTWGKEHAPHLCSLIQQDEELSEAGITVDWMSKTKKKYNDGNVLVGSFGKIGVGFDPSSTEGWDGVHFDLLLLLGTTKSLALLEQLWGRAFRSAYPHIVVFLDANRKADGHWKEMNKIAKLYQADVLETQEILTITNPTE